MRRPRGARQLPSRRSPVIHRIRQPRPEAIPLLREAIRLRRHDVPHFLALTDSTRLLVRALRALAAEGKQEEAMAILEQELKEAPKDGDLLKLLRTFNDAPR